MDSLPLAPCRKLPALNTSQFRYSYTRSAVNIRELSPVIPLLVLRFGAGRGAPLLGQREYGGGIVVVAFDLMWINGRDYRSKPLLERKTALRKVIPKQSPWVLYADYVVEYGVDLFRAACERDLEGIIAKRKDEPYADNVRWVKIKNQEYSQAVGRREQCQRSRTRPVPLPVHRRPQS